MSAAPSPAPSPALYRHKRADLYLFPPERLVIIGLDTPHVQGEHPLWRADANKTADESLVASVRKHGILQPIRARRLPLSDVLESPHIAQPADEYAEVVVGRERVRAARVLASEGRACLVPVLLWPSGTTVAEVVGAANAENYARKTESLLATVEHVWVQLCAEGGHSGVPAADAIRAVSASTGISAQRIRYLIALREDASLVTAVRDGTVSGESAVALASLPAPLRAAELARVIADRPTVGEVRERVAHRLARSVRSPAVAATTPPSPPSQAAPTAPTGRTSRVGIGKAALRRVLAHSDTYAPGLATTPALAHTLAVLRVVAGRADPDTVPELANLLRAAGVIDSVGGHDNVREGT